MSKLTMCGRYNIDSLPNRFAEIFEAQSMYEFGVRYNVAPTQTMPVIRVRPHESAREIVPMRWGLIPSWAKDEKIGNQMFNARCETVSEKPAFRLRRPVGAKGDPVESCTITTTNELVSDAHDRMPVILSPHAAHRWLDPHSDESTLPATPLLPYPAPQMAAEQVSTLANSPQNDSVECLEVVERD